MQATTVQQALILSAIGITLVFVALFVLWGFTAALTRITARWASEPAAATPAEVTQPAASSELSATAEQSRRAAAAAVAVALALAQSRSAAIPPQATQGPISPWQATIRGNAMSRRAGVYRRNPPPT